MPSDRGLFIMRLNYSRVHPGFKIKQARRLRRHRFSAWLVGRSTGGRLRLPGGLPTSQGAWGGVKQARRLRRHRFSAWQPTGVCVTGLARLRSLQTAGKGAGVGTTSAPLAAPPLFVCANLGSHSARQARAGRARSGRGRGTKWSCPGPGLPGWGMVGG